MALTCSLPTPTTPRSSPAPSLALSFPRTLRSQRAANSARGAFYINRKVWARGGRGPARAGPARSRLPAVVKGELGRGAPTSASGWQNPGEPSGERASVAVGRPPAPPGQAGPAGAAGAGSHRRPPRSKPIAPPTPSRLAPLLPAPAVPAALPGPALVVTYTLGTPLLATACTERWNLSPGSRRLLASRPLPKLRQQGSPVREKGALGSGCH